MNHRRMPLLAASLAVLALAPALRADDDPDTKNEITVFGGISLLDADRSTTASFGGDSFEVPAMGRFGFGRFGRPGVQIPPISFEARTSLGSSAIFGARYSREIKDRLFVEADLQIAPTHSLELSGSGCVADVCVPGGRHGRGMAIGLGLGERNVIAWHYGAGLAYELMGGDIRPFVVLGAGAATWDGAQAADTDFALRFGAGLKILFGRVGARVDVVDHLLLDHFVSGDSEHDVHVTAGLLVRF